MRVSCVMLSAVMMGAMSTFDVRYIFKLAAQIEENGYKFYTAIAEQQENEEMKNLFSFLASEEVTHQKTFEGILSGLEERAPVEIPPTEYFDYLRAFVDKTIFPKDAAERDPERFEDLSAVLEYSIGRESDSILYYHEIKSFAPESEHKIIDKIIHEEHRHYVKLSELAKQI